jgi:hypothetical protein
LRHDPSMVWRARSRKGRKATPESPDDEARAQ